MNRRQGILALMMLPLATWSQLLHAKAAGPKALPVGPASLTIDLDSWSTVKVQRGGRTVTLSMAEIFEALKGADRGED